MINVKYHTKDASPYIDTFISFANHNKMLYENNALNFYYLLMYWMTRGGLPISHMSDFSELIKIRDFNEVTTIKLPIIQVYD